MIEFLLLMNFAIMDVDGGKEQPRRDPILAPDDVIRAMIPRDQLARFNVNVQFDSIRLPQLTANQLIRWLLKRTRDGGPLYLAVQELMALKKAERLDLSTLLVRGGQRSKTESIMEFPHPTEFDPALVEERVLPNGSTGWESIAPVTPGAFTVNNSGRSSELEATIGEDGVTMDLNIARTTTGRAGRTGIWAHSGTT